MTTHLFSWAFASLRQDGSESCGAGTWNSHRTSRPLSWPCASARYRCSQSGPVYRRAVGARVKGGVLSPTPHSRELADKGLLDVGYVSDCFRNVFFSIVSRLSLTVLLIASLRLIKKMLLKLDNFEYCSVCPLASADPWPLTVHQVSPTWPPPCAPRNSWTLQKLVNILIHLPSTVLLNASLSIKQHKLSSKVENFNYCCSVRCAPSRPQTPHPHMIPPHPSASLRRSELPHRLLHDSFSVLNHLPSTVLLNASLSAKLQSPSAPIDLEDRRMARGASVARANPASALKPAENLDMIVEHQLVELGTHTLRVSCDEGRGLADCTNWVDS